MSRFVCWFVVFLFFSSLSFAKPLPPEKVPDELKPWIDWVLQQHEYPERACPFLYSSFESKYCEWSTELDLDLMPTKGSFTGRWQVYKETWIILPGDEKHWALNVSVNDKPALVMDRDGQPAIKVTAGVYTVKGEFLWDETPDNLTLPEDMALINLKMNGQVINMPTIRDGQLWLKDSERGQVKPENVQNRVDKQVFRKVIDDVPMLVSTHIDLEVSGVQREEKISGVLLDGFIPLELKTSLPARLEADGQLTVQLKPGRWEIEVLARSSKADNPLTLPKDTIEELWVFEARPELRVVDIPLDTIDASQTLLPDEWKSLPAYKVTPDKLMTFTVKRRGNPDPEPNKLSLVKKLWLDFDGSGYTVNDTITGKMTRDWRLNALPDSKLGKVTLDGNDQLITEQGGTQKKGVEIRQGTLNLDADSRVEGDIDTISATGWEQNFHEVRAELNLPPGWRLFAATGVDNVPDSWIARWTLLDLFLVLITSLTIGKLWNYYWGGLALLTLTVIWHEADAPQFIWLNILAATALLRVLPDNLFAKIIEWYRRACWLVLLCIVLPFMVDQVRIGIYPQLERPWQEIYSETTSLASSVTSRSIHSEVPKPAAPYPMTQAVPPPQPLSDKSFEIPAEAPMAGNAPADEEMVEQKMVEAEPVMKGEANMAVRKKAARPQMQQKQDYYSQYSQAQNFNLIDPKAKVQTGPGLPQWQWHKVFLTWNGTVNSEQKLSLWYLTPTMTMFLNFLRVLLIALLTVLMLGGGDKILPPSLLNRMKLNQTAALLFLCVLPLLLPAQNVYADDFPSNELLEQLRTKLQEEVLPDCIPECAHIQQMALKINEKELEISLEIHAQHNVVLPLPADYTQWFPNQVLDDGKPADNLYRTDNALWMGVKAGKHTVIMRGMTPILSKFALPLPLKPNRVTVEKTAWELIGLQENGWADEQLQFTRIQAGEQNNKNKPVLEQGALPPFIRVERTLQLGLDWRVVTEITRISPADSAVVLAVPLLKGESVTTENIRVKDHAVEVNMAAQQTVMRWESALEKIPDPTAKTQQFLIELTAPDTEQWIEVWKTDISPVWHLESSGIAMIHLDSTGQWLPEWHPWANETVKLSITRPESVAGQTLTIDNSRMTITQGKRMRDVTLKASLRSSQGMQHTLTLPENAQLQSVAINGKTQPLRLEERKLTIPVNPGKQELSVTWQEAISIERYTTSSTVDLGANSVNSNITLNLGKDRWVLAAFGSRFGPIILFWGVLVVIVMVSYGLGKVTLTPLKSWHWFLLLLGLSQIPMEAAGIVVAWLMLLGWRNKQTQQNIRFFNTMQVGLALITLTALSTLCGAVAQGLLDSPDMLITGNRSSAFVLNWYQDRTSNTLPEVSVFSLSVTHYRILMLLWSLWLASALLKWLKWGWSCFAANGLWRKKIKVELSKDTKPTSENSN